jgi:hypothetical protein
MIQKATFQIIEKGTEKLITEYPIYYSDAQNLHHEFIEAQKVWDEYMVRVVTDSFNMESSMTYKEQLQFELSK